ncbi:RNA 2',3'-cyclic phosphodiesterase [Massilia glaciei]|uniref:RNA 2',3'-cyclic phosphodiesterase n=2 Tax=Massilia glaciei TaxID=1524097 RepID=A0A2U2HI95_9BURK|nr:RNA 2',3'-cyclic phosphodiesterase [Massilia glaciei]
MSTPDPARLFLALWPSPAVRAGLLAWRDGWDWPRAAAPVAPERLHLTLHFLGNVPDAVLPDLVARLRLPLRGFALRLGRAALWPHGVAVLEPAQAPPALLELRAALGGVVRGIGLPLDARPFRPHVTLARRAGQAAQPGSGPVIDWRVRAYALMSSTLGERGAYSLVQRYPLGR